MTIPEFAPIQFDETIVSVLCTGCKNPIVTAIAKWEMDMLAQDANSFVLVHCGKCDTLYSYIPASATLVLGEIPV